MGKNIWFELRAFVKRAVRESELHALDANSFALLEWVVDQTQNQKDPIFMQQLVMESKVASPATTLKCVGLLEDADLVSVTTDPKDARRKMIRPTRRCAYCDGRPGPKNGSVARAEAIHRPARKSFLKVGSGGRI